MADNIAITAGSGTSILTDDCTTGHAQIVKLAIATDGSATLIPADSGGLLVNLGTNNDVTAGGDVAHDTGDRGNPVKVGQKAIAHGANPTAVAAGDRTNWYANRAGVPFVMGGHPNVVSLEAEYTAAQTDTAFVTVAAGTKIVVTQAQVLCDETTTATPQFRLGFGTANTPTTTGVVLTHPGLAGGGGVSRGDGSGIRGVGADDADLRFTCEVPTGGALRVLVSYYTIES
jgi:hypothetical protein